SGWLMRTQDIEYEADGRRMVGYLAVDDFTPGRRPAVLVAPQADGLDGYTRGRAMRLASLGYAAFALDLHGDGQQHPIDEALARIAEFDKIPNRIRAIGRAGLDLLIAQPEADPSRVAAVGYCYGGAVCLELARDGADLRAVVGFHARLSTRRKAAPNS